MKIAILTSGILPLPAVKGGAVENLLDDCLKYNDAQQLHDITVYSIANEATKGHPALQSKTNRYVYIEGKSLWAKIRKNLEHRLYGEGYYHYTIEYFFRQAWRLIQKEHYDIILLDNRPGYATGMKVPAGSRLFIYLHNDLLNNQTRDHQKIYDAADHILTVSNYIASRVRTINPDDKKCIPILNGIDNKAFSPDITSNVTRQQLGFNDNDFIMVFSGRITKEKGVSELIDAMISLNSHPNIKLLIIGSPFYGDTENEDDFVRQLKQKASTIQERIRFTGFIAYAQMPSYLKISDIAVIPSLWDDPCPNTVLEAQAMGLPIITTRRGGIPEEVNEEGAILLPTDNHFTNRLAQAILSLYQNEALRQQMSAKLLTHSTYYSTERYVQDFYHALSTVHLSGKKHSE